MLVKRNLAGGNPAYHSVFALLRRVFYRSVWKRHASNRTTPPPPSGAPTRHLFPPSARLVLFRQVHRLFVEHLKKMKVNVIGAFILANDVNRIQASVRAHRQQKEEKKDASDAWRSPGTFSKRVIAFLVGSGALRDICF